MADGPYDKMTQEEMTHDEKANTDKLEFYFNEKVKVHITLNREATPGKNAWLNGEIVRHPTDRLWIVRDRDLGEVRLSISEIKPWGVNEFKEDGR